MITTRTVADVLVETLVAAGVKRIYGIVGDSLNGITNAIQHGNNIQWIHTRHEECAAFAAGAEAQITGQLAVCAGSSGPGNLHLINGLYDCHRNRVPVLAIAADIPSSELGGGYFQETDPKNVFANCSFFCESVTHPAQMPRLLAIAIQTALTRRGVSVLIVPGDVALQKASVTAIPTDLHQAKPIVVPNAEEIQKVAALLNSAKKVTIFGGAGCANAHDEVVELCNMLQAPIVHALRGKEYLEYDNPFDVGMTGLIGFSSGYYAMEACDTLLLLGTSFPYRQFYPTDVKIIQVDLHGEQLGRRCNLTLGVVGDIKETIRVLLPQLKKKKDSKHLQKAQQHYKQARAQLDSLETGTPGKTMIHPEYLIKILNETAAENTIFTCDVGTPTVWSARYIKMNGKRCLVGSFNHGSMANALSQAIGAQATCPNRQVVALCGDGGFSMLMGDFLTLIQCKLPVKVIVLNNGLLGFVDLEMKASGFMSYGTDLKNPNFAAVAMSVGALGIRVEDPAELKQALQTAFKHQGPCLIDVVTNPAELVMPPTITAEECKGFGLYLIKAVISGHGGDIVELVKENLWR